MEHSTTSVTLKPKPSLTALPAELLQEILNHVLPTGLMYILPTEERMVLRCRASFSRKVSVSFLRTSKALYRCKGQLLRQFWKQIVLHVDLLTLTYATTGTGSWKSVPRTVMENVQCVRVDLMSNFRFQASLENLKTWPQLESIEFEAGQFFFEEYLQGYYSYSSVPPYMETINNLFKEGGGLSHIDRKFDIYFNYGFLGMEPAGYSQDPILILNELNRACSCDIWIDGRQSHWKAANGPNNNRDVGFLQSLFIKSINIHGTPFWLLSLDYYARIAIPTHGYEEVERLWNSYGRGFGENREKLVNELKRLTGE